MFLERAFGITSDGTVTIELTKEFKSVKTYEKYTNMIHVMSNWGDDAVLKEASSDDPVAAAIRKFRKSNTRGYNYVRDFKLESLATESPRLILKHKMSGGIVSHMLNIFDVIHTAHTKQGHFYAEKTLAICSRCTTVPLWICVNCSVSTALSVMRSIQMCNQQKEQRSPSCHWSSAIVHRLISLI